MANPIASSKREELVKFQTNLFIGKKVLVLTETIRVEGFVFMLAPGVMFLNEVTYKFTSRRDGAIVAEGISDCMEVSTASKNIILLGDKG